MGCHNSFRARARARTASHSFVVEAVHGHTFFGVRARARARARKMQNGSVSKQTALRLESQEKSHFSSTCGTVVTSKLKIRHSVFDIFLSEPGT